MPYLELREKEVMCSLCHNLFACFLTEVLKAHGEEVTPVQVASGKLHLATEEATLAVEAAARRVHMKTKRLTHTEPPSYAGACALEPRAQATGAQGKAERLPCDRRDILCANDT